MFEVQSLRNCTRQAESHGPLNSSQEPDLSGHVRWTFRCVPVGLLGFPVVPVRNGVVGLKAEDARPRPKDVPTE